MKDRYNNNKTHKNPDKKPGDLTLSSTSVYEGKSLYSIFFFEVELI